MVDQEEFIGCVTKTCRTGSRYLFKCTLPLARDIVLKSEGEKGETSSVCIRVQWVAVKTECALRLLWLLMFSNSSDSLSGRHARPMRGMYLNTAFPMRADLAQVFFKGGKNKSQAHILHVQNVMGVGRPSKYHSLSSLFTWRTFLLKQFETSCPVQIFFI